MIRKLSMFLVAGALALAGCAHKPEKKEEPVKQEPVVEQPVAQPVAQPPPPPTCTALQVLDNNACLDVASQLVGARVEIPCKPGAKGDECTATVAKPTKMITLGGKPGQLYDITVHVRGVMELNSFAGGQSSDFWTVGGTASDKKANVYQINVSQPAQTFFLNTGNPGKRTWAVSYDKVIRVDGGATLTLVGDAQDGKQNSNHDTKGKPQIVPDVPPAPAAFEGQFVQIDAVSVAAGH